MARVLFLDNEDHLLDLCREQWDESHLRDEVLFEVVNKGRDWPRELGDYEPDIIVANLALVTMSRFILGCFPLAGFEPPALIANDTVTADSSVEESAGDALFVEDIEISGNARRDPKRLRELVCAVLGRPYWQG